MYVTLFEGFVGKTIHKSGRMHAEYLYTRTQLGITQRIHTTYTLVYKIISTTYY